MFENDVMARVSCLFAACLLERVLLENIEIPGIDISCSLGNEFALEEMADTGAEEVPAMPVSHDRHRGGGRPPTPATPPYVRVRIRRVEKLR
jgi:hypothetical protein